MVHLCVRWLFRIIPCEGCHCPLTTTRKVLKSEWYSHCVWLICEWGDFWEISAVRSAQFVKKKMNLHKLAQVSPLTEWHFATANKHNSKVRNSQKSAHSQIDKSHKLAQVSSLTKWHFALYIVSLLCDFIICSESIWSIYNTQMDNMDSQIGTSQLTDTMTHRELYSKSIYLWFYI